MNSRISHPAIYSRQISNSDLQEMLETGFFDPNSNQKGFNAFHAVGNCPNQIMYPRIQLLFTHNVNINSVENETINGNTPLHTFIANERNEGVKFIIEEAKKRNININYNLQDKQGKNCLILATKMRQENIAIYLLEQTNQDFNINLADQDKMTALHYASALGMSRLATALCKKGADLSLKNKENQFAIDCTEMNEKDISAILKSVAIEPERDEFAIKNNISDSDNQPLSGLMNNEPINYKSNLMSIKSNQKLVSHILKECMFDSKFFYELQLRKVKPSPEQALQYFIEHPMPQSEKDSILRQFDIMSGVSCVQAVIRDQKNVRNILIENGADYSWLIRHYAATNNTQLTFLLELPSINQYLNLKGMPSGKTALHQAAAKGQLDACKKLIAKGANINAVDANGNTPIMLACLCKKSDVMLTLAEMGASVAYKNKNEKTIFHLLNQTKQDTLIPELTKKINQGINVIHQQLHL